LFATIAPGFGRQAEAERVGGWYDVALGPISADPRRGAKGVDEHALTPTGDDKAVMTLESPGAIGPPPRMADEQDHCRDKYNLLIKSATSTPASDL